LERQKAGEVVAAMAANPGADDPEQKLLVECNQLAVEIDNEIVVIHNFIRDKYRLKFPELESLVCSCTTPSQY
jgi:U4/U6 small nuclear ribonucleoprotein PRP31